MSKNKIFIFFVISFLIGIFFGNTLFNLKLILIFLCFILMFFTLLILVIKKHHFFVLITVIGIFIGLLYSSINNYNIQKNITKINNYNSQSVYINAEIIELYKKTKDYNSYVLKIISINKDTGFDFNFLLYTTPNIVINKGQVIEFQSNIDKIDNFSDNFNYEKFMQLKNIYFVVNKPTIEFIGNIEVGKYEKFINIFRQKMLKLIYEIYPKNEAILLAGLLIGARENFDTEFLNSFNNSGLTHIISVSGFNITIIIIFLGFLFKSFPLFLRVFFTSILVIFFVLLVGDSVAVIRAAIMGLVGYYILILGRGADSLSLLLLTALLMLLYNPLYLNYDISFHLSFLAVVGLLYFQNFWNKVLKFLPRFFAIKESFVLTMSAMTTTIPIMIFTFGQVSILAPVANMLVGGVIPFTMLFGFLSILGQIISYKVGFVIGFINYFLLNFIISVAQFIGNLDFSVFKINFGIYSIYLEILYFMILVFLIIYFKQEKSPKLEL